ncbi:MAG: DUF1566 domain-containing protein [Nitrospirae bacterium]|nr:DUF1566 domain-containing protein [Nitrospirota bacterium]
MSDDLSMGYDVFISYDSRDLTFADKLVSSLKSRGIERWLDREKIVAGEEFDEEIFKAITGNPKLCMVVVLSEKTLQSKYVKRELILADTKNLHIIPVLIEDIELTGVFAIRLAGKHNIEAFNPDIDVAEKICIALKKQKPALPIPSPTPTPAPTPTPPPKPMPKPMPTRFADNGDQTITDTSSGLMWTKNPNLADRKNWEEALDYVASMNKGTVENFGYTDWRLPDKEELEGLVKGSNGFIFDWLKSQGLTNVQSMNYWSSTAHDSKSYARIVGMNGSVSYKHKTNYYFYIWPVRSIRGFEGVFE